MTAFKATAFKLQSVGEVSVFGASVSRCEANNWEERQMRWFAIALATILAVGVFSSSKTEKSSPLTASELAAMDADSKEIEKRHAKIEAAIASLAELGVSRDDLKQFFESEIEGDREQAEVVAEQDRDGYRGR